MAKKNNDPENVGSGPADINKARYYLSRWLGNRQSALGDNMGTMDHKKISLEMMKQLRGMYGSDYVSSLFDVDRTYSGSTPTLNTHVDNVGNVIREPQTKGSYTRTDNGSGGEVYRTVYVGDGTLSTAVHESAHSMEAKPQERKIDDIVKKYGASKDSYLDSSGEIHSRLMEFRHDRNLDPKKKYTLDDIKDMRKNYDDKKLLDRYSDEMMLELLNDVAYVRNIDGSVRNA